MVWWTVDAGGVFYVMARMGIWVSVEEGTSTCAYVSAMEKLRDQQLGTDRYGLLSF